MHGWIILDKPLGLGSTQGVSAVKRCLRQGGYGKGIKVGHGGTLDPLATGVLPIAVGEATKLAGRMLDSDKVYDFTIRFGEQTATLDAEGEVVATSDLRPTRAALEAVLPRFTGPINQVPPAYSALKIDGERAYDLARAGEEVVLASRAVTIHNLHSSPSPMGRGTALEERGGGAGALAAVLGAGAPPLHHPADGPPPQAELGEELLGEVTLTAHVSKGTYIRSLARDIALALGTVGHVTMLRRIKAGPFTLAPAISLDKLNKMGQAATLEQILLPLRAGLDDIPALALDPDQAGALRQGRVLAGIAVDDGQYFAMLGDTPVALVEALDAQVRVVRGFNLD
ncbi:tRNA pseudouridine(55) synthase TruB [Sphingomonas pseudosanguinis]|uniref:tRNA pseudouridine synthase B n=1 Tax=Sphingomonas pseudosanguinis TaxID=413712 RepID=A0A7W6A8S5_9SPHN|nr:tRNA pseudouridine(55) synthase TruB [Sphingomonas pseudosanguinis]MBB3877623.1 tRNA pseudouridine55 synthase [Sphingomonas pseudosanguinis]MBN3537502.1 tRNA pseudouridine(55) synthase TruB [Sphingomonas pseudosanguinis]